MWLKIPYLHQLYVSLYFGFLNVHSAIMNLYIEIINMIPDWNLCYNIFAFGIAEHYSVLCDICLIGKFESSIGFIFLRPLWKLLQPKQWI